MLQRNNERIQQKAEHSFISEIRYTSMAWTTVFNWDFGSVIILTVGHYDDVKMNTIASQITSPTIVYSTVYSGADQRKHQSSASLAFVWGIHRAGEFPAQMASNAENVSIWWRHHDVCTYHNTFRSEQNGGYHAVDSFGIHVIKLRSLWFIPVKFQSD